MLEISAELTFVNEPLPRPSPCLSQKAAQKTKLAEPPPAPSSSVLDNPKCHEVALCGRQCSMELSLFCKADLAVRRFAL